MSTTEAKAESPKKFELDGHTLTPDQLVDIGYVQGIQVDLSSERRARRMCAVNESTVAQPRRGKQ